MSQFISRLASIVGRIRAAAPRSGIVVTGPWNEDVVTPIQTNALFRELNTRVREVATRANVDFANLVPLFNPSGDAATERERLCALTFVCSEADGHPTDAGYRAIAAAVADAAGLKRGR
jgi:lysophospholipase L1-like esterase